jgi:signal transduction histidine kinase
MAGWLVAIAFWLYYLTPVFAPGNRLPPLQVVLGVLTGLAGFVLFALRGRFPVAVPVLAAALLLLWPGPIGAVFAAVGSLARSARNPLPVIGVCAWALVAKLVALLAGPFSAGRWGSASTVELTVAVGGLVAAVLTGALGASREAEQRERAIAGQAVQEAEHARLEQARAAERERIAREMHDVLAHRLSLVAMHAGALAYRTDLDQQTARDTAALIQTNAKQSLAELRAVLTDLRGAGSAGRDLSDRRPEPPQPTLDELNVLLAEDTDQRVELDLAIDPAAVPAHLSRQAYRIVQEALTNARRHAPGAPVQVGISGRAGAELMVEVSNPVSDLALPGEGGAGLGLIGIVERAENAGGTARHGVVHQRGNAPDRFEVEIRMPWTSTSDPQYQRDRGDQR